MNTPVERGASPSTPTGELGNRRCCDQALPGTSGIGTGRQVVGTLSRLFLDEDHRRFG